MNFGVVLQGRTITPSWDEIKEIALKAEELGFHSIWVSDHLMHPFPVPGKPEFYCHEAWTLMSALAALTERIKLGFHVLIPAFRGPAILAKMAATLDIISKGRLIMSLGAGWFKREYEAFGIPWEEHDERINRLEEAILIIKALWTRETATFYGKYYCIKDAVMEPKPLQRPHPPIWVGGNSHKTMELSARLADGWYSRPITPEKAKESIDFIKKTGGNKRMAFAITLSDLPFDKQDQIIESILKYADAGITYITITFPGINEVKRFANSILSTI
ncbi:MAG: LLM class flavin-dependent oxidoreductase [Candidatus Bathyarchaeia archaeon]